MYLFVNFKYKILNMQSTLGHSFFLLNFLLRKLLECVFAPLLRIYYSFDIMKFEICEAKLPHI